MTVDPRDHDWLAYHARETPDAIALVDGGSGTPIDERAGGERGAGAPITWREWNTRVQRTARVLLDRGLAKGDRLAILAANCPEWLDLVFACQKTGIVLQALNWRLAQPELEVILGRISPRLLVVSASIAFGVPRSVEVLRLESLVAERERVRLGDSLSPYAPDRPGNPDPWMLCYTGGTTGTPKAALLTHGSVGANAEGTVRGWALRRSDIGLVSAPLFHAGGLHVFTTPLAWLGATAVLARRFDAGECIATIVRERVTLFFGVPAMFRALTEHPDFESADLSSLRFAISGGAPISRALCERLHARGIPLTCGYGLTEAGPNNFHLDPREARERPGSVGRPLPHVEVRLVTEDGADAGDGEPGELRLRGPHLMSGYLGEAAATAAALDDRGFLRTGDIAVRDGMGCHVIVGRTKEMFISGGENVFPGEVEEVLEAHPAVAEAAVVGAPDDRWGEVGWAAVVLRAGHAPEGLEAFARSRLAAYKVPRRVVPVAAIPRTATGKVDRRALLDLFVA